MQFWVKGNRRCVQRDHSCPWARKPAADERYKGENKMLNSARLWFAFSQHWTAKTSVWLSWTAVCVLMTRLSLLGEPALGLLLRVTTGVWNSAPWGCLFLLELQRETENTFCYWKYIGCCSVATGQWEIRISAGVVLWLECQAGVWENQVRIPTLPWKVAGSPWASHTVNRTYLAGLLRG